MLTNLVAVTTALAATASAFDCHGNYFSFFNRNGPAMSYQRLDPALFPGTQSPHLHSFDGGNGLTASTNFAKTQGSSCSTARVKTDKSLYWRPTLFWNGNGTGYYRVPEKSTKIYYKYGDGNNNANVSGFPEDFNMVAGFPMKRSDGDNPGGVRWACHQPDGASNPIFSNGFPKGFQSCKYGFATEITFPSCWNGKLLDPKDPYSHVAYPNGNSGIGIENCPTTHRAARFPTIFIEFWYDISAFDGKYDANSVPWVLSQGDPTGFGFHADFLNGWEKGVLEKATGKTGGCNCGCGCGQAEMEQCFGSENVNKDNDAAFQSCSAQDSYDNLSAKVFETLPGCNPIQSGPASATMPSGAGCTAGAAAAAPKASGSSAAGSGSSKPAAVSSVSAKATDKASSANSSAPSSKVVKDDASVPSITAGNKKVDNQYGAEASATAAPTGPSNQYGNDLPALSLASPAASSLAAGSSGKPVGSEGDCKTPVTVTITPTVYVTVGTAGAAGVTNSTSCSLAVVTKTLTELATVTVTAHGGVQYGSY